MYCSKTEDLIGSEREAVGAGWKRRRFHLAEDGLPFSVHETSVAAGSVLRFKYWNHSETVYGLEGSATLTDINSNRVLPLHPGTLYVARIGQ